MSRPKNRRRRRSVRVTLWLLAGGAGLFVLCCGGCGIRFSVLSDPDSQITVREETTVFTQPRRESGEVDLVGAMDNRFSEGVTTENNAVVLLAYAIGPGPVYADYRRKSLERLDIPPLPELGDYFLTTSLYGKKVADETGQDEFDVAYLAAEQLAEASGRRWVRNEFPDLSALIDSNQASLDTLVEASARTSVSRTNRARFAGFHAADILSSVPTRTQRSSPFACCPCLDATERRRSRTVRGQI